MSGRTRRLWSAAALLALTTAGCGSTVTLQGQGEAGSVSSDGLSAPAGSTLSGSSGAVAGSSGVPSVSGANSGPVLGGGQPAGATTTPAQQSGASTPGQAGAGPGSGRTGVTGPGVTPTTITIGLVYVTNSEAADKAFGANGITNGNDQADVKAVVDNINRNGGVAGRKLVILPYGEDGTSAQPYSVTAQQMCSFMTQDHKVLAVILGSSLGDPEASKNCLNQAGTAAFDGKTLGLMDSDGHSQIDFSIAGMNMDRSVLAAMKAWTVGDWYSPWNTATGSPDPQGTFKMGILTEDDPSIVHAVHKVLLPALARDGHTPPAPQDIVTLHEPSSAGDDGAVLADIQNAVLKFRQDGVTHVLVTDSNGSATLFFANDAFSQHYYPRLGGGTGNAFQTLMETGNIQQKSVVGAVGAGWIPVIDLPYNGSAHKYESPAAARCRELMKAAGQTFTSANPESVALGYCDGLTELATALNRAPSLTALGLAQGAETIGRSLPSALTAGLDIAPGHHDAAGAFYANVYDNGCGCFQYRGARQLV
jgi:hypothetical protein